MAWQDGGGTNSVVAEVIVGHDMYFLHASLGALRFLIDLKVLGRSTFHERFFKYLAIMVKYTNLDTESTGGYFPTNGIYPIYAFHMKSAYMPRTAKEKPFAKYHESCRKDVERAFRRMLAK